MSYAALLLHVARNTDPPHGSHECMLESLPGNTVIFDMGDATTSKGVLFFGEEPSPGGAR